jgi:hypothetical protein
MVSSLGLAGPGKDIHHKLYAFESYFKQKGRKGRRAGRNFLQNPLGFT